MADSLDFQTGDSLWALTRKILSRLNTGIPLTGSIGTVSDTIADGNDVTQGAKADAAATDSTSSWTVVSLLKGIWAKLNGGVAVTGNVGGRTTVVKSHPSVTASAYSAGFAVGGKQTLSNALTSTLTGVLESLIVIDRANQKAAMDVFIFDADPTAATTTDHGAFVFSTDDLNVIARVSISPGDYVTVNSKAVASLTGLGQALKAGTTTLYAVAVTSGTPTYAATTDVQFVWGILQD